MQKKLLFTLWLLIIILFGTYFYKKGITVEMAQDFITQFGVWSVLIYMLAYTIRPLIFFPTSIMTPLAAILFGPFLGWLAAYIGENFSANFAFVVGRYFGRDLVKTKSNRFLKKYDKKLSEQGFETVIFLRLVPLFPFDFVNYTCGLSGIKQRQYFLATAIGVIPGLTAYIFLGASFASNPLFIIPTVLLFGVLIYVGKKLGKKN